MEHKNAGNAAIKNGDLESALIHYTKAIEMDSSKSIFFSNRANVLKKMKKYNEALEDCHEAIEIDSKNIKGYYLLGLCLLCKARDTKRVELIDKACSKLRDALSKCRSQKKEDFERQIRSAILKGKKLKYLIEIEKKQRESMLFKSAAQNKINSDPELSEADKTSKLQSLEKLMARVLPDFVIPEYYKCPVTKRLIFDPVISKYGNTFDKTSLKNFVRQYKEEPIEKKPMSLAHIYPNFAMKDALEHFLEQNPWAFDFTSVDQLVPSQMQF